MRLKFIENDSDVMYFLPIGGMIIGALMTNSIVYAILGGVLGAIWAHMRIEK